MSIRENDARHPKQPDPGREDNVVRLPTRPRNETDEPPPPNAA
jgi:hypothetical protein